jgi:hypothetical protein
MAGQGTSILASDYNAIQSTIANILGAGSGTNGYGQAVSSSQVAVSNKITAVQWQNLRNDLLAVRQHQTGDDQSGYLTAITTANLVREYDRAAFYAFAQLCASPGQVNIIPPAGQYAPLTLSTGTRNGSPWNTSLTHTVTLNFGTYDNARYFFNAGSVITFVASNLGAYSTNSKGTDWHNMLSNMGTITMSLNTTTRTGSGTAANIGYYQLTTSPQVLFTKSYEDSSYSPNKYEILGQVNGTGAIVTFTINFKDDSGQPNAPWGTDELVYGDLTSLVQTNYASGSNVSVSAYLPSVTSSGP